MQNGREWFAVDADCYFELNNNVRSPPILGVFPSGIDAFGQAIESVGIGQSRATEQSTLSFLVLLPPHTR